MTTMNRKATTLAELATAAGVSTMTASRAINNQPGVSEATRATVKLLAAQLGYAPNRMAQKLSTGQSRVLGVLVTDLDKPYDSGVVAGVVRAAAAAATEVLIYSLVDRDRRPTGNVPKLLQQFTDGVIAVLPYEQGFIDILTQSQVPVVSIDTPGEQTGFVTISADDYGGARKALSYLAELGHKRIAFVAGEEKLESARQRHRAYDDAVAILGLEPLILQGHHTLAGGRAAGETIAAMKRKRPTAIFASNDVSAFGVLTALQSRGIKVPDEISVLGFDDLPAAAQVHPALTTVRQPIEELGRSAVNTLLALVAGLDAAFSQVTLPTELIVRKSTAPPPAR
jgi:LacI family transcriptional regulator